MGSLSREEVEIKRKKLRKSLNYYFKKKELGKISEDDFLIKIRTIARPLNILDAISITYNVSDSLADLKLNYENLLFIGSPEEYYIKLIKLGMDETTINFKLKEFEEVLKQVHDLKTKSAYLVKYNVDNMEIEDLLQSFFDDNDNESNDDNDEDEPEPDPLVPKTTLVTH
jgi:hypothetical protein